MTTELLYFTFTAILLASLWIPHIVGINIISSSDPQAAFNRPVDLSKMPAWFIAPIAPISTSWNSSHPLPRWSCSRQRSMCRWPI